MADKNGDPKLDLQEKKIPVFTVLKHNSILKNIFLLHNPPSISDSNSIENGDESNQELEEFLLVGRHPDCNITLEHPSISRYHLRIHSKPSSQNLSVVDLSSVHGTWISGKKIEPGVSVHLKEGDSMQLGGSSRVYRLHWVPLSRAYHLDDPFVPPLEAPVTVPVKEMVEETHQDEDVMSVENNQLQSSGDEVEAVDLLFPNKILKSCLKKVSPSAPPMPELLHSSYDDDDNEAENKNLSRKEHELQRFDLENQIPQPTVVLGDLSAIGSLESPQNLNQLECSKYSSSDEEQRKFCSSKIESEQGDISSLSCEPIGTGTSSLSSSVVFLTSEDQNNFNEENSTTGSIARRKSQDTPGKSAEKSILSENSSVSAEGFCSMSELFEAVDRQSSIRKDHEQRRILPAVINGQFEIESNTPQSFASAVSQLEDSESTLIRSEEVESRSLLQYDHEQKKILKKVARDQSQNEDSKIPLMSSEEQSNLPSIWLRRGKPATVQIQISKSRGKGERVNMDDVVEPIKQDNITDKSIPKDLFGEDGEETFTPDKENFTPNTLLLRSMKNKDKVEEITSTSCLRNGNPNTYEEENPLASSEKENQTPLVLQERKSVKPVSKRQPKAEPELMKSSRVVTRVPFQSLLVNSTTKNSNCVNYPQSTEKNNVGGENKRWVMVADTNCLLNKESRKALQLLQGLKGTQLIIPRIVLRELDSMKRRGSLFRKRTDVSSALQWIEECMLNTKWWIHIQSTSDEGRPLAPTPTTLSPFNEENCFPFGSLGSPACGGLLEIVSPTAQDHVLECALAFRRIKNDGHLVLLSNDVALKIKAMAECLLCEGAEEFQETLVNPFSGRFLWADSSPRGPTWSCKDDVVLREKYERCPLRKKPSSKLGGAAAAAAAKGLKLILLHSSQYRHISSAS